jgi:hypothetical protein
VFLGLEQQLDGFPDRSLSAWPSRHVMGGGANLVHRTRDRDGQTGPAQQGQVQQVITHASRLGRGEGKTRQEVLEDNQLIQGFLVNLRYSELSGPLGHHLGFPPGDDRQDETEAEG